MSCPVTCRSFGSPTSRSAADSADPAGRAVRRAAPAVPGGGPACGPARRPEHRARRLRPLRPARRPGPLPPGRLGETLADAPIEQVALLRIGAGARRRRPATSSTRSTTGSRSGGFVVVDDYDDPDVPQAGRRVPRPSTASPSRSSGDRLGAHWRKLARGRYEPPSRGRRPGTPERPHAVTARRTRPLAEPGDAPAAAVDRQGPLGRRRLLQHAARGGPHPPLAVARLPAGHRRPRLRGDRRRERLGPRPAARRRVRRAASGPSSATSTSATTPEPSPVARAQPRASPSPRATTFALMIDGAHVLTPGVLRFGMAGLAHLRAGDRRHPAVVRRARASRATRWPTATTRPTRTGCSSAIDWPADGYRLFEIGHFIGDRDWFDGLWESNCIFVPRALLEQVGRLRRELLDARRRLRQPRALRAARLVARRHRRHHPRRGLVPPGPRRHHHQPGRRRRAPPSASAPTPSTSPSCAAALPRPRQADPLRRHDAPTEARPHPGPPPMAAERSSDAASTDEPDGLPDEPDADPEELAHGVHRRVLAQPRLAARRRGSADRSPRRPPTSSPTRSCISDGPARLDHRDRHRRRRPRAVPRLDLRAARPRPGARRSTSDRAAGSHPRLERIARPSPPTTPTTVEQVAERVGDELAPSSSSVAPRAATTRSSEFEAYAPLVPVGLLRGRRATRS